jgi:hypothetical protein
VRPLPAALAISAALHGGAIAYVQTRPEPKPEEPRAVTLQPIQIVPAAAPDPEPMVVALLDDHSVPSERGAGPGAPAKTRASRPTVTAATSAVVESPQRSEQRPKSPLLTMRRPEIEHGPGGDFMRRFLANSKPLAPKDLAGEQRADEIAMAEGHLHNPRWVANATPEELTAERMRLAAKRHEQATAELQPDGAGKKAEHETFVVKVAADGSAKIRDKANLQRKSLLSGSFDVTDALMRKQGIDPYSSYKLEVLDDTRDERVAIGKQYRTQQLARSKQLVQRNIERLVAMQPSPVELKQGLFELWDDCAETGTAELVAGGKHAREHVIGFIRSRLPSGSADAFTPAELARYNKRRRSQAEFAPY